MILSEEELNLFRQWFNAVQDLSPEYLTDADRALFARIESGGRGAIDEIAVERRRQIEAEGWSTEHDDQHTTREMAEAAACYTTYYADMGYVFHTYGQERYQSGGAFPGAWPWDKSWWKPKSPRRDLIRAAALIAAEIERLDRMTQNP